MVTGLAWLACGCWCGLGLARLQASARPAVGTLASLLTAWLVLVSLVAGLSWLAEVVG